MKYKLSSHITFITNFNRFGARIPNRDVSQKLVELT